MQWRIHLFGILEVHTPEGKVVTWRGTQAGLLLAHLALHLDSPQSRESLAEWLWADGDSTAKRTRLRQEIADLRLVFGGESDTGPLSVSRTHLCLRSSTLVTDVSQFTTLLERARKIIPVTEQEASLREAITLYTADLLTEYPDHFEPQRTDSANNFEQALQTLAQLQRQQEDYAAAIATLKRLVARDALRESVHADLMRLYASVGQYKMVRQQYQQLEEILREQLGVEPGAATRQLLRDLREQTISGSIPPSPVQQLPVSEPVGVSLSPSIAIPSESPRPHHRILPYLLSAFAVLLAVIAIRQSSAPHPRPTPTPSPTVPPLLRNQEQWVYLHQPRPGEKIGGEAHAIAPGKDGSVYVTGFIQTEKEDTDMITLQLSLEGKPIWMDRYSSPEHDCDRAFSMTYDSKAIYVAGETYVPATKDKGDWYLTLIKYSEYGKRIWVRRSPVPTKNFDHRVRVVADHGTVYLAGTAVEGEKYKILLLCYSSAGDLLWKQTVSDGNGACTTLAGLTLGREGVAVVCGTTQMGVGANGVNNNWVTASFGPDGKPRWRKLIDGDGHGDNSVAGIARDGWGNLYVSGILQTGDSLHGGNGANLAITKYSPDGTPLWTRANVVSGPSIARSFLEPGWVNRSITIGANKQTSDGHTIPFIARYDTDGNCLWTREYPVPTPFSSAGMEYLADFGDHIFLCGNLSSPREADAFYGVYGLEGTLRSHFVIPHAQQESPIPRLLTHTDGSSPGIFVAGHGDGQKPLMVIKYASPR